MYKTLTSLNQESVELLQTLKDEVRFRSDNIRIGANKTANRSVYSESKWYDWTRDQKSQFKTAMGNLVDNAVVGWFINFPKNGFLDEMDYWLDKTSAGTIVAYSLTDNNKIIIQDEETVCQIGEGISFSLKQIHEIKPEPINRTWACIMQLK